jgi:hypothetical protein
MVYIKNYLVKLMSLLTDIQYNPKSNTKLNQALSNTSTTANHTNTDIYYDNLWNYFEYLMKDGKKLAKSSMYRTLILNMSQSYEH